MCVGPKLYHRFLGPYHRCAWALETPSLPCMDLYDMAPLCMGALGLSPSCMGFGGLITVMHGFSQHGTAVHGFAMHSGDCTGVTTMHGVGADRQQERGLQTAGSGTRQRRGRAEASTPRRGPAISGGRNRPYTLKRKCMTSPS